MSIQRTKELESQIIKHRSAYYNDKPLISDKAFDALIDELVGLDPHNKTLIEIGSEPVSNWEKYQHAVSMGSLDKCNTPDEFEHWADSYNRSSEFFITHKLDGLSVSLCYEDGKLVSAATRGSGTTGENIFRNVVRMKGVPLRLPNHINAFVRGEIVISKLDFTNHFSNKDYSNARNAASGTARRHDGEGCQHLQVLCYEIISDDMRPKKESEQFFTLADLGFYTPPFSVLKSVKEVVDYKERFQDNERQYSRYELDGLVIRENVIELQKSFGDSHGRPRGAIAYKFANEGRQSTIRAIEWSTGNNGRCTPVATFDVVNLDGADLERASLYNYAYIQELGLDIGTVVIVERANMIIPRVAEVVESTGSVAKAPSECHTCNTALIEQGEHLMCLNTDSCPAQVVGRIKNWINALNILSFGDKLIERLVEVGKVKTIVDLYRLSLDDLAAIDRMGKKSAFKCYERLWAANPIQLDTFLGSLSIPLVGAQTVKLIVDSGLNSIDQVLEAPIDRFLAVKGLGEVKAKSLFEGLKRNREIIDGLFERGIAVKGKDVKMTGELNGKSFVITGKTNIKRADLGKMIEAAGGVMKGSVSKGVDFLVAASEDSESTKDVKARELGTVLISEDELLGMME